MTAPRKQMIEDMRLAGHADGTQQHYLASIREMAKYFGRSPDELSRADIRRYLPRLRRRSGPATVALTESSRRPLPAMTHIYLRRSRCPGVEADVDAPVRLVAHVGVLVRLASLANPLSSAPLADAIPHPFRFGLRPFGPRSEAPRVLSP